VAQYFGFKNVVVADYPNFSSVEPDAITIDVSEDPASHLFTVEHWRKELRHLANDGDFSDYLEQGLTTKPPKLWVLDSEVSLNQMSMPQNAARAAVHALPYCQRGFMQMEPDDVGLLGIQNRLGFPALDAHMTVWGTQYEGFAGVIGEVVRPDQGLYSRRFLGSNRLVGLSCA
jgi:hypothetical protein